MAMTRVTRFGSTLRLVAVVLIMCATAAQAAPWEDALGPHATTIADGAGPAGRYYIHRPRTLRSNAHPIAVLAVGTGSSPKNYDALLAQLASHGVVVIADTDPYQADGSKASAAVNWLVEQNGTKSSGYFQALVPSKVLAIGHSSGGNAAMLAAINNPRVTSLLLYAPVLDSVRPSEILVPTFYVAGSLDSTVTPQYVKARYLETVKASAWYGENANQSHIGFARNPSVQYFTRAWVYAHLLDDAGSARGCFYGPGWSFENAATWKETLRNNGAR